MARKNYCMQVRMTREQYRKVQKVAEGLGFSSLSDYVRYQVLDRDWSMERKVAAMHDFLLGSGEAKGFKRNPALDQPK